MKPGRWPRERARRDRVGIAPVAIVLALLLGGCAGQLDLAPEAYATSSELPGVGSDASPGGSPTSDAGAAAETGGAAWGPTTQPVGAGPDAALAPEVGAEAAAPWPAPDAAAPDAVAGVPDALAMPAPSVCPAGVDALTLLSRRCGSCHGERMAAKGLDLVTPGIADRILGAKSTCQGKPLLDPLSASDAPGGHFIDKINGPVAGCGAQMPYGTPPLLGADRDCLLEWAGRAIARARKGNAP